MSSNVYIWLSLLLPSAIRGKHTSQTFQESPNFKKSSFSHSSILLRLHAPSVGLENTTDLAPLLTCPSPRIHTLAEMNGWLSCLLLSSVFTVILALSGILCGTCWTDLCALMFESWDTFKFAHWPFGNDSLHYFSICFIISLAIMHNECDPPVKTDDRDRNTLLTLKGSF